MAIGAQRARASLVCRAMPLVHKTQPVPRAKAAIEGPAPGGSALANPELVWKIRFTTEKFREYSYVRREAWSAYPGRKLVDAGGLSLRVSGSLGSGGKCAM